MVSEKGDRPLYMQVYEEMLQKIEEQEWRVGSRIPSELELCKEYSVSRMTIRLAMQQLAEKGYIERKQGKGTFVTEPRVEQKLDTFYSFGNNGERAKSKVLTLAVIPATQKIAKNLEVDVGAEVYRLERIRSFGENKFAYENSYLPYKYGGKLSSASIEEIGLYNSLNQMYGVSLQCAVEIFEAVNMRRREAQCLEVSDNHAAMKIERIAKDGNEIIEYCVSIVRGDKIKYRSELR